MADLFTPMTLRDATFSNRIAISSMCQYSCEDRSGIPTDWHQVHLGSRAVGAAGLVMVEATGVTPEGRISPEDTGLWNEAQQAAFAGIVEFVHGQEGRLGIQLAHAGRKASTYRPWAGHRGSVPVVDGGWETVGPMAEPFLPNWATPHALTKPEIASVIEAFRAAAGRALAADFDVVELHAAHGYLLNQFQSPLTNRRTDDYGGSFEHRIRLTVETVDAVREVWPASRPLFVRISAVDWAEGGWSLDDSVRLAQVLKDHGVDLMDCSGGGVVPVQTTEAPGYMVPFAERIRAEAQIATAAVGRIEAAQQAQEILSKGRADLVMVARASLRDPAMPMHWAQELGMDVRWPAQYRRARPPAAERVAASGTASGA